jgi:signal transduction histidine kinase
MRSNNGSQGLHTQLRLLAVEDPRRAREQFLQLLDSGSPLLEALLRCVSAPGEGRLRQIIANAVRSRAEKERLIPFLIRWREVETDEFAARAINAALDSVDLAAYRQKQQFTSLADPQLVEAYRYATSRLNHQMRNALLDPSAHIIRLRAKATGMADDKLRGEFLSVLGELDDSFQRIGRIVEATEVSPDYFRMRSVTLVDWLGSMNTEYGRLYSPIKLGIDAATGGPASRSIKIQASDYHLKTIFWNLWINSQQAVGDGCAITVRLRRAAGLVEIIIIDNGDGFSPAHLDVAFQERYSSSSTTRGRGLLEVQEAVGRLHGEVGLVEYAPTEYRVRIVFPPEVE